MPTKLRVRLAGNAPESPHQHASGLRALVFGCLEKANPAVAAVIHDANQPKPCAITPLMADSGNRGCWYFEVSSLVGWLTDALYSSLSTTSDIVLGRQSFKPLGVETVASVEWEELVHPRPGATSFGFRLLSPTAHHAAGPLRKSIVLPAPENYFGSWLNRWNLCSDLQIPPEVARAGIDLLAVSAFSGSTASIRLHPNRVFIGFEGTVQFALLQPRSVPPETKAALLALARLSSFCGTGVDTMLGMGQTVFMEDDG